MKLFLIHCGYYDPDVFEGAFESHGNFFVMAEDFASARLQAKLRPEFKRRKMHIDGIQQIEAVEGYRLTFERDPNLDGQTHLLTQRYGSSSTRSSLSP